ncbi:MAG: DUF4384 domain-containing protein [Spirochaetales bacterium]|nr:DUF4384 domain-containing protein [Spirochaetales bacterium]
MKKKKSFLSAFIIFILLNVPLLFPDQREKAALIFQYAFLFKKSDGTGGVVNPNEQFIDLKTGDNIKIYLKPTTSAYIYLYLHNSEGILSLIFPQNFTFFSGKYKVGTPYFLPSEEKWYRLKDPSGIEEFHLIVSKVRLKELELLSNRYFSLKNNKAKEDNISDAQQDILDTIKDLKIKGSDLVKEDERPVPIPFAGVVRTLDNEGLEIFVRDIYAKTIRIRH